MSKSNRKKPATNFESELKRIKEHLADMVSYGTDLQIGLDNLNEGIPNLNEVGDKLDISIAEDELGNCWKLFNRAAAHEWLGKAYGEVEILKNCHRRAASIAFELNEVFEQAEAAAKLAEFILKKVDTSSCEEGA